MLTIVTVLCNGCTSLYCAVIYYYSVCSGTWIDITVTLGTVLPGCYTEVTCLCSDPVMYGDHLGLFLLTGIDQKSGLDR